jgi:hypothetical protein
MDAPGNRFCVLLLSYPGQDLRRALLAGQNGHPALADVPLS